MLPLTSVWKSDGYNAMIKLVIDSFNISEYNSNILFKEYLYEDNEWY
jgi:hypothetical protein